MLTVKAFLELKRPDMFSTLPVQLTKREQQVLIHLALGLSNKEISAAVRISIETVKEHVQNVLRKLSLNDRTAAAVWALRAGVPDLELRM
jgi:DNA-binding NarL/FixJ family response regulator